MILVYGRDYWNWSIIEIEVQNEESIDEVRQREAAVKHENLKLQGENYAYFIDVADENAKVF